jgi:hypothetical protein
MQPDDASAIPDGDTAAGRIRGADFDAWERSLKRGPIRRVVTAVLRAGCDGMLAYGAMVVPQGVPYRNED